jgi:molybdopterin-guanine dinucleotide biosynthesis protein A
MRGVMPDAVLLLAGGASSRLPNKLERSVNGKPLILHAFDNLYDGNRPMYLAASRRFPLVVTPALDITVIYDAEPSRGPLWALLDASAQIESERIFAVAADLPHIAATVLHRLAKAYQPGDDAVVPKHARGVEPLAALYDRDALRRAAKRLSSDQRAMRDLLATLHVRYETMESHYFTNINTPGDLERATA